MNIEERNAWLVDNIEHVTRLLTDFCDRYKEVEFEELYLEIIERLIAFLDSHEQTRCGYFTSSITGKESNVFQWILNQSIRYKNKKSKKVKEEPHYCFELLYLEDLELNFVTDYIYTIAKEILDPMELAVFLLRIEWECTFDDISAILGFRSRESARRYFENARRKLYWNRDLRFKLKDYRDLYLGGL